MIPAGMTNIDFAAFEFCSALQSIRLPDGLQSLGPGAFYGCSSLTNVTIPASVTVLDYDAFFGCANLEGIYFIGDTPTLGTDVFGDSDKVIIYYLPGTSGWSSLPDSPPSALWNPQMQTSDGGFVLTNGFGFGITGTTNIPIVVEACTNLMNPFWTTLQNCTITNGSIYFSDAAWMNSASRFYRIRSP
jgi:hypothetical protein